jgi:anti-anti-sigma factor
MSAVLQLSPQKAQTVHVEGALQPAVSRVLHHNVRTLLLRGERRIVLDMSAVSGIDAAGVGELIRAFNVTVAGNGVLRIVNATAWVREMLERAHLFDVLSGEPKAQSVHSSGSVTISSQSNSRSRR